MRCRATPSRPAFDTWLPVERYRVSASIEAHLLETAYELLAEGLPEAVDYASRLVVRNGLDEGHHELLVRVSRRIGESVGSARTGRHRRGPPAARARRGDVVGIPRCRLPHHSVRATVGVDDRAAVTILLDAGRAALLAGAADTGIDCLRRAVDTAAARDAGLHGRALTALGSALVHSVRGGDGEGSAALHEAVRIARATNDRSTLATACRELGFVEVQAVQRHTANDWLDRAAEHADDEATTAAILGVHGMCAAGGASWRMVCARNGDPKRAATWFDEALRRCGSVTDQYQWVRAAVLDSMVDLAVGTGDHLRAMGLNATLSSLAARCEMRDCSSTATCTALDSATRPRPTPHGSSLAASTIPPSPECWRVRGATPLGEEPD